MEKPITEKPVTGARKIQLMLENYIGNEPVIRKSQYVNAVVLDLKIPYS